MGARQAIALLLRAYKLKLKEVFVMKETFTAWVIKDNRLGDYVTSIQYKPNEVKNNIPGRYFTDPGITQAKIFRYKPIFSSGEFLYRDHPHLRLQEVEVTIKEVGA